MILIETKRVGDELAVDVKLAGKAEEVEGELVAALAAFATVTADDCDDPSEVASLLADVSAKAVLYAEEKHMEIRAAGLKRE